MKQFVIFTVMCVLAAMISIGCESDGYLNQYARIEAYRVVNINYNTGEDADVRFEYFTAITETGDTLTQDDFDSIEVMHVGIENARGDLEFGNQRGPNGKYPRAVAWLILGNTYRMHYQERG
jgi:hypothetical protein